MRWEHHDRSGQTLSPRASTTSGERIQNQPPPEHFGVMSVGCLFIDNPAISCRRHSKIRRERNISVKSTRGGCWDLSRICADAYGITEVGIFEDNCSFNLVGTAPPGFFRAPKLAEPLSCHESFSASPYYDDWVWASLMEHHPLGLGLQGTVATGNGYLLMGVAKLHVDLHSP